MKYLFLPAVILTLFHVPAIAQDRAAVRAACLPDVKALCSGIKPGGGRIMACMKEHKDEVSQGCKDARAAARAARRGTNGAPGGG